MRASPSSRGPRTGARAARAALALLVALVLPGAAATAWGGCGYLLRSPDRPTPGLLYRWPAAAEGAPGALGASRAPCLLVLLPGFFDEPETFEERGLIEDLHAAAPRCDVLAVATHLYDYGDESIVARVHEDVVLEARRRGYEGVWLVGISMGALGAILAAIAHPGDVDGLVLVSPYLGTAHFAARFEREIARHGDLAAWARATPDRAIQIGRVLHDPRPVWRWLAGYRIAPAAMPPLWVAYGRDDRFAPAQRLLAEEIAPERTLVVDGAHDWDTWRRICHEIVAELPVAPGPSGADEEHERRVAPGEAARPGLARHGARTDGRW